MMKNDYKIIISIQGAQMTNRAFRRCAHICPARCFELLIKLAENLASVLFPLSSIILLLSYKITSITTRKKENTLC